MFKIKTNAIKVAELRIKEGMTCREFAKKAGIHQSMMSRIECGKADPSPAIAKKITEGLQVQFDDIFSVVE